MKLINKNILIAAFFYCFSLSAFAEMSANIGVTSNYIWRGQTQTSDNAAVSGGFDVESEHGFSAGIWTSTVDFSGDDAGNETDLYVSYASSFGNLDVSVGGIYYMYTEHDDSDFSEATLDFGYQNFSFGMAYVVGSDFESEGDLFYHAGFAIPLSDDIEAAITYGLIKPDDGENGSFWQVDVSKGDFTFSVVKASNELDSKEETKFVVSWGMSF